MRAVWRTCGGRIVRLHGNGTDLPHCVLHLLPVPNQFAGKTILRARRETVLRGGLFEHAGKVFGLHDSHLGAYSAGDRQALSSGVLLLRGVRQESRRRAIYGRRHQPEPLHRGFPQVST